MIAVVENQERLVNTRRKLNRLRAKGYQYLMTNNDGDTWIGSKEKGLEIDELIVAGFIGEICIEDD